MKIGNGAINAFSKSIAFIYIWIRYKLKKRIHVKNNKVLIISTGHIGNALLDAPALYDLKEHYVECGKEVVFLCSKSMWNIYTMLCDFSNVEFIGESWHYHGNGTRFTELRIMLKPLEGLQFETAVMTLTGIDNAAYYFLAITQINKVYGVFDDVKHTHGSLRYYFERCFSNKVFVSIDLQEQQRLKILLETLGVKGHKARIQHIENQGEYTVSKSKYITVTVDSMATERRWPHQRFVDLIKKILKKYPYDIYITGSKVTEYELAIYDMAFTDEIRVKNLINKTTFKEWIELIRNAQFHVGVDSGSIHVAASTGTLAFCITGVWDAHRVLPYKVDKTVEGTKEPVCIYPAGADELACYACKVKGGRFGRGNGNCYRECRKGNPCLCLEKISAQSVMDVIEDNANGIIL